MLRSTAISAAIFMVALGCVAPASADDTAVSAPRVVEAVEPVNPENQTDTAQSAGSEVATDALLAPTRTRARVEETPLTLSGPPGLGVSVDHIDIIVENSPLSVRSRRADTGGVLIEADPIFTRLKGEVTLEDTVLSYKRQQDGAILTIDMTNGVVTANGQVQGALPDFRSRAKADTWLSPNAISFLTGTVVAQDDAGNWSFTLVDALRAQFDLDLWIEGQQITNPEVEPRTIGPVLLVPLEIIAETLGQTLTQEGNVVTIFRVQDATTISLDLSTGLVSVNTTPRGITPDIAFADPDTLLLPFNAVETLTGTHVELVPGTDKITVTLDDRLGGGVLPGERVVDEVAATGFVPESVEFLTSDRGPTNITFASRFRGLNTQLRYDTVGGFDSAADLRPAFLALDIQSIDGWVGSVGDTNSRFRELEGVGINRLRGVTFRKKTAKKGNILALSAGAPVTGSETVAGDASRPTFGGFAAGGRVISRDGNQEFGASAAVAPGGGGYAIVAGGQKRFVDPGKIPGLDALTVDGDVGVFNSGGRTSFDARVNAQARFKPHPQIGVQANIDYDSGFSGGVPTSDSGVETQTTSTTPSRFVSSVSTDWRSVKDWGPLSNVAAGVRGSYSRTSGDSSSAAVSIGGSVNARITRLNLNVSANAGFTTSNPADGETSSSTNISVRALKRFNWGTAQATYTNNQSDGQTSQQLVSNLSILPFRKSLGKGASVSAGPTASFVWTPERTSARFGAVVTADSGRRFGDKFKLRGQVSAAQSVDPEDSDTQFFASLNGTYNITRNLQLQSTYVDTFDGSRNFSVALRGRVAFNAPRKHTRPKEGLGVLKGQVYFDRNRDGIRQEDEPGISNVRVQIIGTGLGLNVDRNGLFTIQNLKQGLYGLNVDRRSLPLGLLVPDDVLARATIGAGRITELEIPLIASGQIRGTVFVDDNTDGEVNTGERRIDGTFITLNKVSDAAADPATDDNEPTVQISASFGQYSFENLSPGRYELTVNHEGIDYSHFVDLTEDELFAIKPFSLPPEALTSQIEAGNAFAEEVTGAP